MTKTMTWLGILMAIVGALLIALNVQAMSHGVGGHAGFSTHAAEATHVAETSHVSEGPVAKTEEVPVPSVWVLPAVHAPIPQVEQYETPVDWWFVAKAFFGVIVLFGLITLFIRIVRGTD